MDLLAITGVILAFAALIVAFAALRFRLARLPCFRGVSPRGEELFPVSTHGLVHVPPPSTPPNGASRRSGFGSACCLRRS